MLNEVKRTMIISNKKIRNLTWDIEKYKKNQMEILELEYTISEINVLDRLNGRR